MSIQPFHVWIHVYPNDEPAGSWTAHCLDLDLLSLGTSPRDALMLVYESAIMLVQDDLNAGRAPLSRRAPKEEWELFETARKQAQKAPFSQLDSLSTEDLLGAVFTLMMTFEARAARERTRPLVSPPQHTAAQFNDEMLIVRAAA